MQMGYAHLLTSNLHLMCFYVEKSILSNLIIIFLHLWEFPIKIYYESHKTLGDTYLYDNFNKVCIYQVFF
jgi:hypothetical protein